MGYDIQTIRSALVITLSILLVVVLWRRLKRRVVTSELPAPLHVELLALEVEYHPARLRVLLTVPKDQMVHTSLLDAEHRMLHEWTDMVVERGESTIQLALPMTENGKYHLEVRTATQRTMRQFRLQQ